jgi:hypothetical protein
MKEKDGDVVEREREVKNRNIVRRKREMGSG